MKKIALILSLLVVLASCKKDRQLYIGQYVTVKPGIFNTGVFRPVCPCRIDSLYIDKLFKIPYASIYGGQTGEGAGSGNTEWYIPQEDLR